MRGESERDGCRALPPLRFARFTAAALMRRSSAISCFRSSSICAVTATHQETGVSALADSGTTLAMHACFRGSEAPTLYTVAIALSVAEDSRRRAATRGRTRSNSGEPILGPASSIAAIVKGVFRNTSSNSIRISERT
jgi:hypothetical protein